MDAGYSRWAHFCLLQPRTPALKAPQSFSGSWRAAGTQKPESGLCSEPRSTHRLEGAAPASLQAAGDQTGHGIALISVSQGPFRSSVTVKINK